MPRGMEGCGLTERDGIETRDYYDYDAELIDYIERLVEDSKGCLDKNTIAALTECSLTGEGHQIVTLPDGLKAVIPCSDTPEAWANILHIYCHRDYELLDEYRPKRGWIILDAGAYLGLYTLRAASLTSPTGVVVAVEPHPRSRRILEKNVELNELWGIVHIDPRAVACESRYTKLYEACYPGNNSLLPEYVEKLSEKCGVVPVRTATLEEIVEDHGLREIHLLKLDIEGYEEKLLRCMRITPMRIVVEVHPPLVDPERVSSILRERGYQVDLIARLEGYRQAIIYAKLPS